MTQITRSKGGTAERQVNFQEHMIPDLWHVATYMETANPNMRVQAITESGQVKGIAAHEAILDCWHLAHDLIKEVEKKQETITALNNYILEQNKEIAGLAIRYREAEEEYKLLTDGVCGFPLRKCPLENPG